MRGISTGIIVLCFVLIPINLSARQIHVITDSGPHEGGQNGIPAGPWIDLIRMIMDASSIRDYCIESHPWARAYNTALRQENTMILPLARTKKREGLFRWAGMILPVRFFLVRRKGFNIRVDSLDEAKRYRIGVIRDDVSHQYLSDKGVYHLSFVSRTDLLLGILDKGRVDLVCITRGSMALSCRKKGQDCSGYIFEWEIGDLSLDLYAAFSRNTDDSIVQKISKGIADIEQEPAYREILNRLNTVSD